MTNKSKLDQLRSKCQSLDCQSLQLEVTKNRLQECLEEVRQSMSASPSARSFQNRELVYLEQKFHKKFESATNFLKMKFQWELDQALCRQKKQLKLSFRSDLVAFAQKNLDLMNKLSLAKKQLQCLQYPGTIAVYETSTQQTYSSEYPCSAKFQGNFFYQTNKLEIQNHNHGMKSPKKTVAPLCLGTNEETTASEEGPLGPKRRRTGSASRSSTLPFTKNHEAVAKHVLSSSDMNDNSAPTSFDIHPGCNSAELLDNEVSTLYPHQQYVQFRGFGLETLPEASSEDESLTTMKDNPAENNLPCIVGSEEPNYYPGHRIAKHAENNRLNYCDSCQNNLMLQSKINQLNDELKECRDQNELLEFRLLELEGVNSNSSNIDLSSNNSVINAKSSTSVDAISGLSLEEVSGHDGGYGGSSHQTVTESRSSCSSDCSESLSLQESGIFDGQSSEDSISGSGARTIISRELSNLSLQIEELLQRYNDEDNESPKETNLVDCQSRSKSRIPTDFASDVQYCFQKVLDFERRLLQMGDVGHIRTLEERVSSLLSENKKLEEEKSEIEEAENDNRYLCQRLEEKVQQLRKKKANLQSKLNEEKLELEKLKFEIAESNNENSSLAAKITSLESLLQNYEQRNFELEESCIEMRCSIQENMWLRKQNSNVKALESSIKINTLRKYSSGRLGISPRKHKLPENDDVQPLMKKLKPVNDVSSTDGYSRKFIEKAIQTSQNLLAVYLEDVVLEKVGECELKEKSLREQVEALELDIDRLKATFDQERNNLVKMYEGKLSQKESELNERRQLEEKNQELEERWENLVHELENFALHLCRNMSDKIQGVMSMNTETAGFVDNGRNEPKWLAVSEAETSECRRKEPEERHPESQGAHNPNDYQPSQLTGKRKAVVAAGKAELIPLLQSRLREHLQRFEAREKQLLSEIDRLVWEMKVSEQQNVEVESNMVSYLREENRRLESLFKDHEKVWGDLRHAQEENERLRADLNDTEVLRRRLEETQRLESELRERLEVMERVESSLRHQLSQMERKERKGLEKIQQLRDEIQFLRNKCCQLQDELDSRLGREAKCRAEIQQLANKLRESRLELEEKESQLESSESALQAQIDKLRLQLQELQQTYADVDCTNGMLREEISYLEKTVDDAVTKVTFGENTIASLTQELRHKDELIEHLQAELRKLKMTESEQSRESFDRGSNDLDDFNSSQGGLHGIVRGVEEVVSVVKSCSDCKTVGAKLTEVLDRLIPLIQILKSPQVADSHFTEPETCMKRCESDELLISPMTCTSSIPVCNSTVAVADAHVSQDSTAQSPEEDDILIGRLQDTLTKLTAQMTKLEENLNIKQRELKHSHFTEICYWKQRCDEKNRIIQLLARRIAHLSVTDVEGIFLQSVLLEIRKIQKEFRRKPRPPPRGNYARSNETSEDFSFKSLRAYLALERQRIMDFFSNSYEESADSKPEEFIGIKEVGGVDFRVVRRIGEDALLVSWTMPDNIRGERTQVQSGYEIAVNGCTFLKIPKPSRHKAVLFGLNFDHPVQLTFRCPGEPKLQDSTITFIP